MSLVLRRRVMAAPSGPVYSPGSDTIQIAASGDDADYFNGTFDNSRVWLQLGSHSVEAIGAWTGFRFVVTSQLKDIDPSWVSDVRLQWRANNTTTFTGVWRIKQSPQNSTWDSSTNRPDTIFNSISSSGEVVQASVSLTANNIYQSSDLSALFKTALPNLSVGDYVAVMCGPYAASAGVHVSQAVSYSYSISPGPYPPRLIVTW